MYRVKFKQWYKCIDLMFERSLTKQMTAEIYRNTYVEIKLDAIGYNIQQLKERLPRSSKVMGVVKANGYGHGSVEVAKKLLDSGVDHFMVALLHEAIELRNHGITVPILVIGRTDPAYAHVAAEHDITLTVFQTEWLDKVSGERLPRQLNIHLEFETGMGRTGICSEQELARVIEAADTNEDIQIKGVYTHMATADEEASSYYMKQQQRFKGMLAAFQRLYVLPVLIHTGNSAAGMQYPTDMNHYTRFGIAVYGLYPSHKIKDLQLVNLKPAFSLYSELIQVKQIAAGETISYGATYEAQEAEWIGTIPIGYGDGWRRDLQGFYVLVDGKRMPIVGRVCMDLTMVKLDKAYLVGEKVTLIGCDGSAEITVDDVADYLQTINYEITCMISSRIPRVYRS